ncbi:hypothetical protein BVIET440_100008 [Burkholderia vietnamiensis]
MKTPAASRYDSQRAFFLRIFDARGVSNPPDAKSKHSVM